MDNESSDFRTLSQRIAISLHKVQADMDTLIQPIYILFS